MGAFVKRKSEKMWASRRHMVHFFAMKYLLFTIMLVIIPPIFGQEKGPAANTTQFDASTAQNVQAQFSTAKGQSSYISRLFSPENLLLVVVGVIGIAVAIRTLNHMRESSERQLRAYVLMDSGSVLDSTATIPPQPEQANTPFAGLLIKNFGQTPAYKVISYAQIAVIPRANENTLPVVPPIPEQFSNTLGPSATFNKRVSFDRPLSPHEIDDIRIGTRAIYLYGRIEYQDAFKKRHYTDFRLHYTGRYPPPNNSILLFCERGNDAS